MALWGQHDYGLIFIIWVLAMLYYGINYQNYEAANQIHERYFKQIELDEHVIPRDFEALLHWKRIYKFGTDGLVNGYSKITHKHDSSQPVYIADVIDSWSESEGNLRICDIPHELSVNSDFKNTEKLKIALLNVVFKSHSSLTNVDLSVFVNSDEQTKSITSENQSSMTILNSDGAETSLRFSADLDTDLLCVKNFKV